jgi:acetyl-CoA C-acetyltransferase
MMSDAVIVGWGHTKFGKLDGLSLEDLILAAAREALDNAAVGAEKIDAVWLGHFNSGLVPDGFCSSMIHGADPALRFKPATRCENACASGSAALYSAMDAVAAGRIRAALVVGAEKMTGMDTAGVTKALAGGSYQREESAVSFPEIFARYARAYAEAYGDPTEAMARISVKNHANALRNPLAQMHREVDLDFARTVSDRNPMIAAPLKLSDCSLISDGAAALVLVHRDLLPRFKRAVGFRAAEQVNDLLPLSAKRLVEFEGPRRAFAKAYAKAGVGVDDIDFAEVHDCFTIAELLTMEAMGIAAPGKASIALADEVTHRDGRLPINLSGGLKAKGHPIGATGVSMHVTAARLLTGEAGEMNLARRPELGLVFNMGGSAVANYCSILEPVRVAR